MTISLDEGMAMLPGMGLADFDRVMVIARVSQSGDVIPKPGDMEARSVEVDMSQVPDIVDLVIKYPVKM
ncbi:MAG: hypothetical protein HN816_05475 [Gammaproteobacteria bacterium]|nr:hypothetical protein [Gammaproteobacteria bacterium]